MILLREVRRGSVEVTRDGRPAGILILDRPPAPPCPLLRAYVWSRERTDHSAVNQEGRKPWALMVGPKGSMPDGDWSFAV